MAGRRCVLDIERVGRGRLFFHLENEGLVVIVDKQKDYIVIGADAAGAHNFETDVYGAIAVEQKLMVGGERPRVVFERVEHSSFGFALNLPKRIWLNTKAAAVRGLLRQFLQVDERRGTFSLLEGRSEEGIAIIAGDAMPRHIQSWHGGKATNPGVISSSEF